VTYVFFTHGLYFSDQQSEKKSPDYLRLNLEMSKFQSRHDILYDLLLRTGI
jgi:hypothetical protein